MFGNLPPITFHGGGSSGLSQTAADVLYVGLAPATSTRNLIQPTGAAVIPLVVKGASSQSASLLEIRNSADANLIAFGSGGSAIFNEQGADADFRVEGDTEVNLLFVDASTERVGIGVAAPLARLNSLATTEQLRLSYDASNFVSFTVSSGGDLTLTASGGDIGLGGAPLTGLGLSASIVGTSNGGNRGFALHNTAAAANSGSFLANYVNSDEMTRILSVRAGASSAYTSISSRLSGTLTEVARWDNDGDLGLFNTNPAQRLDVIGNVIFGVASGAAGSRIMGRGEHTSAPSGSLNAGEWEMTVYDDGATPVFRVRYNDAGSTKTFNGTLA